MIRAMRGALDVHVIGPVGAFASPAIRPRKLALSPTRIGFNATMVSLVPVAADVVSAAGACVCVSGATAGVVSGCCGCEVSAKVPAEATTCASGASCH